MQHWKIFSLTLAFLMQAGWSNAADVGQWIWSSEAADRVYFKKTFDLAKEVKEAVLVGTADNELTVYVNGKQVLSHGEWQNPQRANVKAALKPGANLIAVEGGNQGGPAALYVQLDVQFKDGSVQRLVTDGSWRTSLSASGNWQTVATDAKPWAAAKVLGALGSAELPYSAINESSLEEMLVQGDGSSFQPRVDDKVKTLPGFKVEKVYAVPRNLGSWVSITTGPDGQLIACDQGGAGLYRIKPGHNGQPTEVSKIPVSLSGAQGLLWAFDSLYAMVNGGPGSGLHRLTDSDGDGELDRDEHLVPMNGGGEHGPHAVILSPDGKSIYICAGNHTKLPEKIDGSMIPQNWSEDLLLPRRWDANGHAAGILAPGGWICSVNPDGSNLIVRSIGFRNQYDIAFNADGELMSYDADMEWDLGSPWYRPTRIVHATSGSEFGWRSGTGKWPTYYVDSLPPAAEIGPGSPVGISFGYGAKFPAKYQRALFALDWTYSTIYAVHLTPSGSTYQGEVEDFVTGQPLQVTDSVVGTDGAFYFATGGRGTQSAVYRVTYSGNESTAAVDARDTAGKAQRDQRRALEALHGNSEPLDANSLTLVLYSLSSDDRFIRYAARVALEARPVATWKDAVAKVSHPWARIEVAIALARQGAPEDRGSLITWLNQTSVPASDTMLTLAKLRAYQLVFARLGQPDAAQRELALSVLDPMYPAKENSVNAELAQLLVYLNAPNVVGRTLAVMDNLGPEPIPNWGYLIERNQGYGGTVGALLANMTPARAIHYAFVLRNQKTGWTIEQRRKYLAFFIEAAKHPGGNSYAKFLEQMRGDALATLSPEAQVLLADLASVSLIEKPPVVSPPKGPGREWTRQEAMSYLTTLKGRNHERGRNMFHAAQCSKCHRLGGEGGAIGPDLSTAGKKFSIPDMLDAIIEPSKAISDQYGSQQVLTVDGTVLVGRVVELEGKYYVYTADPDKPPVELEKDEVEEVVASTVSQMPVGLINGLNEDELKDLMAYLYAGGNPKDDLYK